MTLYTIKLLMDTHTPETIEDTCNSLILLFNNRTHRFGIFYLIRNIHKLFKTAFKYCPNKLNCVCELLLDITRHVIENSDIYGNYEEWICRNISIQMIKMKSDMIQTYINGLRIVVLCIQDKPYILYSMQPQFYSHLLQTFIRCPNGENKLMFAEIVSLFAMKHMSLHVNVFNTQIYECILHCIDILRTDDDIVEPLMTILTIACMMSQNNDCVRQRLTNVWSIHNIKTLFLITSTNNNNNIIIKKCAIRIAEFAWINYSLDKKNALLEIMEHGLNQWFEYVPRLVLLVWTVILNSLPLNIPLVNTLTSTIKFVKYGLARYELMQYTIRLLIVCIQNEHPIVKNEEIFKTICNSVYKLAYHVELIYLITLMELWLTYSFRHNLKYHEYANISVKHLAAFADSPETTQRIMNLCNRLINVSLFSKCCTVIQKDPFLSNDPTYQFLLHPDYIFDTSLSESEDDENDDDFTPILLFS